MATHSSILAWRIPWTEEPGGYSPWGHKESDTTKDKHKDPTIWKQQKKKMHLEAMYKMIGLQYSKKDKRKLKNCSRLKEIKETW